MHQGQGDNTEGDTLALDRLPDHDSLEFDAAEYLPHMAEFDITEEQATELLTALWDIIKAFVDLGLGVDSIHQIFPELGQVSGERETDQVELKGNHLVRRFDEAAHIEAEKKKDS